MTEKIGGTSYGFFKEEVRDFIKSRALAGSKILDLGCGRGTYGYYLQGNDYDIYGVDVWSDAVDICRDSGWYKDVICCDIRDFDYKDQKFDVIILGDVLEHLSVADAQAVIAEADKHCTFLLVAIPYMLPQPELYGNKAEEHLQPDLTTEVFDARYPGFNRIFGNTQYGYYWRLGKGVEIPKLKVCVYAICKNEMKFVDKWLDNMSEADYICVLDTGSTDGTYEKLKSDPRVTIVKKKTIKPWRFDVARNESMTLIPDDADVLVCTDFDELFNKGWADVVRYAWAKGNESRNINRVFYKYAWSHNDIGEPTDIFRYDKIHNRDFEWHFPVHEVLWPVNDSVTVDGIDAMGELFLQHYPDKSKPRSFYFDLLKLAVEENPDDSHERMLLAREYLINEDWDNALENYLAVLKMPDVDVPEKRLVLLESLGRCADIYKIKLNFDEAIWYCQEFIKEDHTYREPYFILANMYNSMRMYTLAEAMVNAGLQYGVKKNDWVERADSWISEADDIMSVAQYGLGRYDDAIYYVKSALEHHPNDARLLRNYSCYLEEKIKALQETNQNLTAKLYDKR